MLEGLTRIWTSLRAPILPKGTVIAGEGASYSLSPIVHNMGKLINLNNDGQRLKPVEVSSFLYDFAVQDIALLHKKRAELASESASLQGKPGVLRAFKYLSSSDFRHADSLDLALQTREQWIKTSFKTCIQLMKYVPLNTFPWRPRATSYTPPRK